MNKEIIIINLLDAHALFSTLDAEFENERSKFLHARIEPDDVEDIAEYYDLQHNKVSSLRV